MAFFFSNCVICPRIWNLSCSDHCDSFGHTRCLTFDKNGILYPEIQLRMVESKVNHGHWDWNFVSLPAILLTSNPSLQIFVPTSDWCCDLERTSSVAGCISVSVRSPSIGRMASVDSSEAGLANFLDFYFLVDFLHHFLILSTIVVIL